MYFEQGLTNNWECLSFSLFLSLSDSAENKASPLNRLVQCEGGRGRGCMEWITGDRSLISRQTWSFAAEDKRERERESEPHPTS